MSGNKEYDALIEYYQKHDTNLSYSEAWLKAHCTITDYHLALMDYECSTEEGAK